jgi:hypothetical protein
MIDLMDRRQELEALCATYDEVTARIVTLRNIQTSTPELAPDVLVNIRVEILEMYRSRTFTDCRFSITRIVDQYVAEDEVYRPMMQEVLRTTRVMLYDIADDVTWRVDEQLPAYTPRSDETPQ